MILPVQFDLTGDKDKDCTANLPTRAPVLSIVYDLSNSASDAVIDFGGATFIVPAGAVWVIDYDREPLPSRVLASCAGRMILTFFVSNCREAS